MKEQLRKVYSCDHCNKKYFMKHACVTHELRCYKNPDNHRPCFHCWYFNRVMTNCYCNTEYGDQINEVKAFKCTKKNIFLYYPVSKLKNTVYDLCDGINKPMPKECDIHNKTYSVR